MSTRDSLSGRVVAALFAGFLAFSTPAAGGPSAAARPARPANPPSSQTLRFEKNRGQAEADVEFLARSQAYTLLLTARGAELQKRGAAGRQPSLRMAFEHADPGARMTAEGLRPERIYYAGPDAMGPLPGSATYRRVRQTDLYPGIDLLYYADEQHLEFDFIVEPRARPDRIRLAFSGAQDMTLEPDGALVFRVDGDEVRLKKPVIYQERDGVRVPIAGGYRIVDRKARQVDFRLGAYDDSRPLVIDPTIVFATYRGGLDHEAPRTMKVNALGEIYLFADTRDPGSLPGNHYTEVVPLAAPQAGFSQCFLTKIARDGRTALYTLVFEGAQCQAMDLVPGTGMQDTKIHVQVGTSSHYQRTISESPTGGLSIAPLQGAYDACQLGSCGPVNWMRADANGNVYFVMQHTPNGMSPPDFVYELRKIDSQGQLVGGITLIQPPLYPQNGQNFVWDRITGFDVDDAGRAYVLGHGASPGIITPTATAFRASRPSGDVCLDPHLYPCSDAFLMRVDTSTPGAFEVTYASYLGGSLDDHASALVWDPTSNRLVVAGTTRSPDFPRTPGSFFPMPPDASGPMPAFVLKLDLEASSSNQLVFGTFLGPGTADPTAVAVLPEGLIGVIGQAWDAAIFPLVNPLYPRRTQSQPIPFLSVLSADGATLPFSTFLDRTFGAESWVSALAANGSPTIYAGVSTNDETLATPGSMQPSPTGGTDALVQAIDVSDLLADNAPPAITFAPAAIGATIITPTTGAIVPLICGRLFTCTLADADGDELTELAWFAADGRRIAVSQAVPAPADRPGIVPTTWVSLGVGTHAFTLVARDERGAIGTATLQITVDAENTPAGADQHVVLTDAMFVTDEAKSLGTGQPLALTFEQVTAPGLTWLVTQTDQIPPPPGGMQAGSPPYYYDVQSTAAFSGDVRVCFNIRGMSFARANGELRIHRLDGATWHALDAPAATADQLCGSATALGTFAIFYPQVPETAIATFAGTGIAEDALDGPDGDPRDDVAENVPATQSALTRPARLARDAAGRVYVTDNGSLLGSRIRRIDANGTIATVVPAGVCYGFGPIAVDADGRFVYCVVWNQTSGQQEIVRYELATGNETLMATTGEVTAIIVDPRGDLLFSNGNIFRVPAAGGAAQPIFAFQQGAPLTLPYFDRAWTLAFDAQGHLLAGGATLIRLSPGADGAIDGSPDETVAHIGGIPGLAATGYAEPFYGDGLPASQALLWMTYQMVVAGSGAVIFIDQRAHVRRIDPGADGVVNGDADEIVRTIAGYTASTLPGPSAFATSEYGNFRGLVEDPSTPGRFIVSSHDRHLLQRFGLPGAAASSADLSVAVTAPSTATVGTPFSLGVQIANAGPAPATIVTLTLSTSDGLTIAGATAASGTTCTAAAQSITCVTPRLSAGARIDLDIAAIAATLGAATVNVAVSAAETDPQPGNNPGAIAITVEPGADLSVSVLDPAEGASVPLGQTFTYTVAVANHGQADAFVARLNASLSAGLELVSAGVQGGGACEALGGLVCDFDNFAAGTTRTVQIVVMPTAPGSLSTAFAVSSPVADPNPSNNAVTRAVAVVPIVTVLVEETIRVSDAVSLTPAVMIAVDEHIGVHDAAAVTPAVMIALAEQIGVHDAVALTPAVMIAVDESIRVHDDVPPIPTVADLSLTAIATPTSVDAGGTVRLTVTATNGGPGSAPNVSIGMPVVDSAILGTITAPGARCVMPILGAVGPVNCSLDAPLAAGEQYTLTVDLMPRAPGTLAHTFQVASTLDDPNPSNNAVTVDVTVGAATDLAIAVVPSRALLNLNDRLSYAVTVTNNGPMAATGASFTLPPAAGFTVDQVTLPPASCIITFGIGTWTCGLGAIAPGASVPFAVIGRVIAAGPVTSTFAASSALNDPVPANNSAAVTVAVNQSPTVDAGPDREVAGVAPVSVHLTAAASDPDGDAIASIAWFSGATPIGGGAAVDVPVGYGTHTVTVVATDTRGGQGSDTVTITVRPSALPAPGGILATPHAPGQVTVNWAPVAGAAEYRLYRDVDPVTDQGALTGNARLVTTVGDTTFIDVALPPLVRQFYAVVAVSGTVVSPPAPAAEVLVQAHPQAPIFGFADTHSHQFANLGFGRSLIHGSAQGPIQDALNRCEIVHGPGGFGDVVGNFLTGSFGHDTLGFDPQSFSEFTGWPAYNTRTHQQLHHEALRRAFDGGQRLMVMHAESNKVLCQMTAHDPQFSCEDMASIEDQILAAKSLEAQIDNASGGPGRGWYRIAYSGAQARAIINSGKMAVVLGIEVDELFDCGRNATCTLDDLTDKLDHYHQLGVRHVFPVGHFDNAFGGAAMYSTIYSFANWATTGRFFAPRECGPEGYRYAPNASVESVIWTTLRALLGQPAIAPPFPDPPFVADCNERTLTGTGEFFVRELMARGMIIDIDHMSSLAANRTLTIAEETGYPGVVSGHSSPLAVLNASKANEGSKTTAQLTRIYALGGLAGVLPAQGARWTAAHPDGVLQHGSAVVNDCGSSSKTFAQAYLAAVDIAGGPSAAAVAIGSDFNGLGGQPGPRFGPNQCPGDAERGVQGNPVVYPFAIVAPAGVNAGRLGKAATPNRKDATNTPDNWDFNKDGLAHVGLVPDLIEDLRRVGVSDAYLQPLFRSAEAYVRLWERADGSAAPFVGGTLMGPGVDVPYRAASTDGTTQPVTARFARIDQPGYLVAEPMENPPAAPVTAVFVLPVFDLVTTAPYTGPITVCLDGTFTPTDRVMHFESEAWVDITVAAESTDARLCGRTASLSPFAAIRPLNRAPAASAGVYGPVEATSPAGAAVTLTGSGSDPDEGEVLAFAWTEGGRVLGSGPSITTTLALGTHAITLTVTDRHGASASSSATIIVRDTTAPAVMPPAALTVPATEADGTRPASWPALSSWLASATASDAADPAPSALTAAIGGTPVGSATRFPIGTTTVTFAFRDATGNTGSATSTVTVALGTPDIRMTVAASGTLPNGRRFADLSVSNVGTGVARYVTVVVVPLVTRGRGVVTVRTPMPVTAGDLAPGASGVVRIELTVPGTVDLVRLVGVGAFLNVRGFPGVFEASAVYDP